MNQTSFCFWAIAVGATFGLAAILLPVAKSQVQQVQAAPSYIPIGVSASGGSSTVWFHEPSTRRALACQSVSTSGAGLSSIQCVAVKLP